MLWFSYTCRFSNDNALSWHDRNVSVSTRIPRTGGWDYSYLYGNFLIIEIDFWFQPKVRYLSINLRTLYYCNLNNVNQKLLIEPRPPEQMKTEYLEKKCATIGVEAMASCR